MAACVMQHLEVVEVLLNSGKCKLELEDSKGRSALLLASGVGSLSAVRMLLGKGADVKSIDHQGNTALLTACSKC
jgi:ankyrin repeat protein